MDLTERPPESQPRRHPWETVRFEFFSRVVRRAVAGRSAPVRVLDAGAGDGWFAGELLPLLPAGSEIVCWDIGYTPDDLAALAAGSSPWLRFTAEPPEGRFDLLLMLDVLEHIERDLEALSELVAGPLLSGGHAVLSVPAHAALFSRHDVALRHFRRYSRRQLLGLAAAAGLRALDDGGLFHALLVPRALQMVAERVRSGNGGGPPHPGDRWRGTLLTGLVTALLRLDSRLSELVQRGPLVLPGLSHWALCLKP
jgi:SAM-dependent methyltransferase